MPPTTNAREVILIAAEQLVAREGVRKLTIENVAAEARISRGGVLYHFASKELMIQAMLSRLIDWFETILTEEAENDPQPAGRWARAFARATLRMDERTSGVFAPLLAAIAHDPHLVEPFRARQALWQGQMDATLDPVTAAIIRMASHAIWLNDLFGLNDFTPDQKRAIVDRLVEMTRP